VQSASVRHTITSPNFTTHSFPRFSPMRHPFAPPLSPPLADHFGAIFSLLYLAEIQSDNKKRRHSDAVTDLITAVESGKSLPSSQGPKLKSRKPKNRNNNTQIKPVAESRSNNKRRRHSDPIVQVNPGSLDPSEPTSTPPRKHRRLEARTGPGPSTGIQLKAKERHSDDVESPNHEAQKLDTKTQAKAVVTSSPSGSKPAEDKQNSTGPVVFQPTTAGSAETIVKAINHEFNSYSECGSALSWLLSPINHPQNPPGTATGTLAEQPGSLSPPISVPLDEDFLAALSSLTVNVDLWDDGSWLSKSK
jgi:hypothetical protein